MTEGLEAAKRIFGSNFHEQKLFVDESDFVGVKKGRTLKSSQLMTTVAARPAKSMNLSAWRIKRRWLKRSPRMERLGYEYTCHTGITDWSLQTQEMQLRNIIAQCKTTAATKDWLQSITRNVMRAASRAA
jgi:hypothetical protein